jgi:hypothetical protein
MDRNYMAKFLNRKKEVEVSGYCCGEKMSAKDNRLVCSECGKLEGYIEAMYDEIKSQETQYNHSGQIMFGRSHAKTDNEKIALISKEFEEKINNHLRHQIPPRLIRRTSTLMYKIIKDKNGKKKSNRDQLFAACLHLVVVQDMSFYSIAELVDMFGLDKYGIGNGNNHIIKYVTKEMESGTDAEEILRIPASYGDPDMGVLSINIDTSLCLISKYLSSIKIGDTEFNTPENRKFCMFLVDFMNENSVAYNSNSSSKCVGVVYYLLNKQKYASKVKKLQVEQMLGIYQSTMMGVFNVLSTPDCQAMLPEEYRL